MPDGKNQTPKWIRYSSLGLEFGAAIAVLATVGYSLDHVLGSYPWGFLGGILLGTAAGLYRLVRVSNQAFQKSDP